MLKTALRLTRMSVLAWAGLVLAWAVPTAAHATYQVTVVRLAGEQSVTTLVPSGVVFQTAATADGPTDLESLPWSGVAPARQVAGGAGSQLSPSGYGNYVAFVDRSDPPPSGEPVFTTSVKVVELSTGATVAVSQSTGFKEAPSLYGDRLVWTEASAAGKDVMTVDLDRDSDGVLDYRENGGPAPEQPSVLFGGAGDQYAAMGGSAGLVWLDRSTGVTRVLFREWAAGAPIRVLSDDAGFKQPSPCIAGQLAVWKQLSADGVTADVAIHSLDTGATSLVGAALGSHDEQPWTDGTRVVWVSQVPAVSGGARQVWLKEGGTTPRAAAPFAADQSGPRLHAGRLVWTDARNGDTDIAIAIPASAVKATATSLSGASRTVNYAQATRLSGTVTAGGVGVPGLQVVLQASADSNSFRDTSVRATTGVGGTYSLSINPTVKTNYRVRTATASGYAGSVSTALQLSPRVELGTPVAPSKMWVAKAKSITGSLKPRHVSGAYAVRIYRWKRVSGAWKPYGYINARARDAYGESTYYANVSFPSTGTWRIRAYHPADSKNAATWSGSRYATVADVWVSTPVAPTSMRKGEYRIVAGYLKPRHAAGSYPVRIYRWRKEAGKWKAYGYLSAKAQDYATYTKYSRKLRFEKSGAWRIRAYHPADSTHRARWSSSYDYVTVR